MPKNKKRQAKLTQWEESYSEDMQDLEEEEEEAKEEEGALAGKFYTNKVRIMGMAHASYEIRFNDTGQEAVVYHFTETPEVKKVSTAKITMEKDVEGEWRPKLTYRLGQDWHSTFLDFPRVVEVKTYLLKHGMSVMKKPKPWKDGWH